MFKLNKPSEKTASLKNGIFSCKTTASPAGWWNISSKIAVIYKITVPSLISSKLYCM